MAEQQLTAQQRAQLFAMQTRQNLQMLAKEHVNTTPSTVQFTLPKARLLAGAMIRVSGNLNLTHATETKYSGDHFTLPKAIRRISLDLNNGFQPFVLSGEEVKMYNLIDLHPAITTATAKAEYYHVNSVPLAVSSTGADNEFAFTIDLLSALNRRDPIGLILLQNDQTNVTLSIDFGMGSEMVDNAEGYTAELKDIDVSVMLETFSIPANANAFPDLSVLKLVNGRKDSLPSAGQQIIKLTTGTIYRKIIFRLLDEDGNPMSIDDVTSDIQLVFNQADINYSVSAEMLRLYNTKMLGFELPEGMYAFDFSNSGGFTGMGGSRDYIDSANLTEFWLRFNTSKRGKCEIVTETLARLS